MHPNPTSASSPTELTVTPALRRKSMIADLLIVIVIITFALGFQLAGVTLNWLAVGAGALGWIVALMLRAPVAMVSQALLKDRKKVQTIVMFASGPCEEAIRLLAVLVIGRTFPLALSIGLGWAAIEAFYTIVNSLMMLALLERTDEKAQQAKEMLAQMGQDLRNTNTVFLGVLERISASALHISFTLLLAWQPWLMPLTLVAHSATNYAAVTLVRRSILLMEICLFVIMALVFITCYIVFNQIL